MRNSYVEPLSTAHVIVDHASVASSKSKVELDSCADTCVVVDNCLVIYKHDKPVTFTVTIQEMATEVLRQLILQYGIKIHRVVRSLS